MDILDGILVRNRDWDPSYLSELVSQDFYDFKDLWNYSNSTGDTDVVKQVEWIEKYSPIVEDISLDDEVLSSAWDQVEYE